MVNWRIKKGNRRWYPPEKGAALLIRLWKDGMLESPAVLMCPATGRTNEGVDPETSPRAYTDYGAVDNRGRPPRWEEIILENVLHPSEVPAVWDRKGNHEGGRCVVFFDGHTEFVTEEKFQKLLENTGSREE